VLSVALELHGLKKRFSWTLTDDFIMLFHVRHTSWPDVRSVRMSVCRRMFSRSSLMRKMSWGWCREGLVIDIVE
jgi:hypothetical protein